MKNTRTLVEVAVLVALAFVLEVGFSFLPAMPQGGRISLSLLPIIIIAWRNGAVPGIIGGVVYGLLNLMLDGVLYHWGSFFLDYTFAFGLVGLVGFIKPLFEKDNVYLFGVAIVCGFILRFTSHVLSGVLLFAEYAGDQNVWIYSITYNATYLLPAMILTLAVGVALYFPLSRMQTEIYE